ncbi:unnamed protein product [Didymodactylos carnosus]|uniref:Integrase catalytic domain-containing protein n=1 Tax=Didymodactylos carnosus TaxID=1234261 RepID=A0A8S2CXD1_9BILA|nr:unnamed protein product [Didymodactylos carnosus]CAF3612276.1 unnamed protein product [Didymodactylos carnosus]
MLNMRHHIEMKHTMLDILTTKQSLLFLLALLLNIIESIVMWSTTYPLFIHASKYTYDNQTKMIVKNNSVVKPLLPTSNHKLIYYTKLQYNGINDVLNRAKVYTHIAYWTIFILHFIFLLGLVLGHQKKFNRMFSFTCLSLLTTFILFMNAFDFKSQEYLICSVPSFYLTFGVVTYYGYVVFALVVFAAGGGAGATSGYGCGVCLVFLFYFCFATSAMIGFILKTSFPFISSSSSAQAVALLNLCSYLLELTGVILLTNRDRKTREITDQMITEQKDRTDVILKETLNKIAKEAKRFKEEVLKKAYSEGDEKSQISREIQEILNKKPYQDNASEYVYSHLDQIISLILYTWSIANYCQFPKDTQIVSLLLFIHSNHNGLLEQVQTSEGKTLIVGLTAAFLALCGNTKEEEKGNKIRIFLKAKNNLKSGVLAIHKYGNKQEEIDKLLDEILEDISYENDKKLSQSKLSVLQGDIRSYKDGLKATLTDFIDLPDQEIVPTELNFFQGLALNKFLIIKEDNSSWDWNAFAVAMIRLAQVIAGAVLISFGAVNIGGALVAEGISNMVYATMEKKPGHLYPIPPPQGPFQMIGIDYCGPLMLTSRGNRYVLCITDHFSKWVTAVPLPNCTVQTTAETIFTEYICKLGVPTVILSDNGTHFQNQLMSALTYLLGHNHIYSTTYHPQTNGTVERFNATFVPQLAKLQDQESNNLDDFLPAVIFAYNTGQHFSTKFSPLQLQYGQVPKLPPDQLIMLVFDSTWPYSYTDRLVNLCTVYTWVYVY